MFLLLILVFSDTDRRIRALTMVAGPGMLSLVSQSLNAPSQDYPLYFQNISSQKTVSGVETITDISAKEAPRIALTFDDGPNAIEQWLFGETAFRKIWRCDCGRNRGKCNGQSALDRGDGI